MYQDLKGKLALITGASHPGGIGFGIAKAFAENGMHIVLADLPPTHSGQRNIDTCRELLEKEYGVMAIAADLDVTSPGDIANLVQTIKDLKLPLHALVNNAGMNMGATLLGDYDPAHWRKVLEVNLFGPFSMIQAFLPLMVKGSCVVNLASRAGKRPLPTCSAYSTSKAGIIMLTKCLAVEYAAQGIRANAICPGQILTDMNMRRFEREGKALGITAEEAMNKMLTTVPMERIGTPEEVGSVAAFLVSEQSSYMTGQAINVTGGQITEL
ncbi:MAG: SDR family oxidoreductase [Desulfovibrionaceae bacterium]|nr:SDR family oxidoreductase [Desulfovibrionaceae bacterium]